MGASFEKKTKAKKNTDPNLHRGIGINMIITMTDSNKNKTASQELAKEKALIRRLTLKQKKVLKVLIALSSNDFCIQSNEIIATSLNITIRSLQRILSKLESLEIISREIFLGNIDCPRKIFIKETYKKFFQIYKKVTCQKNAKKNEKIKKVTCQKRPVLREKVTCHFETKKSQKTKMSCHPLEDRSRDIYNIYNNLYLNTLDDDACAREKTNFPNQEKQEDCLEFFTPRGLIFKIPKTKIFESLKEFPPEIVDKALKRIVPLLQYQAFTDPISYLRTTCGNIATSENKRKSYLALNPKPKVESPKRQFFQRCGCEGQKHRKIIRLERKKHIEKMKKEVVFTLVSTKIKEKLKTNREQFVEALKRIRT